MAGSGKEKIGNGELKENEVRWTDGLIEMVVGWREATYLRQQGKRKGKEGGFLAGAMQGGRQPWHLYSGSGRRPHQA